MAPTNIRNLDSGVHLTSIRRDCEHHLKMSSSTYAQTSTLDVLDWNSYLPVYAMDSNVIDTGVECSFFGNADEVSYSLMDPWQQVFQFGGPVGGELPARMINSTMEVPEDQESR